MQNDNYKRIALIYNLLTSDSEPASKWRLANPDAENELFDEWKVLIDARYGVEPTRESLQELLSNA